MMPNRFKIMFLYHTGKSFVVSQSGLQSGLQSQMVMQKLVNTHQQLYTVENYHDKQLLCRWHIARNNQIWDKYNYEEINRLHRKLKHFICSCFDVMGHMLQVTKLLWRYKMIHDVIMLNRVYNYFLIPYRYVVCITAYCISYTRSLLQSYVRWSCRNGEIHISNQYVQIEE